MAIQGDDSAKVKDKVCIVTGLPTSTRRARSAFLVSMYLNNNAISLIAPKSVKDGLPTSHPRNLLALAADAAHVRDLGAGEVVNTNATDLKEFMQCAGAVIDTVGGPSQEQLFALARPGGVIVSSVSQPSEEPAYNRDCVRCFFSSTLIRWCWPLSPKCSIRANWPYPYPSELCLYLCDSARRGDPQRRQWRAGRDLSRGRELHGIAGQSSSRQRERKQN